MNNNSIIKFHTSYNQTDYLLKKIQEISLICNEYDNISHPFFKDDEYQNSSVYPWLYYAAIDSEIIGFIAPYIIDSYNIEFCEFILPEYRRKKIATQLFSRMISDFTSQCFSCSIIPENNIGKAFLNQIGFKYASTECSMSLFKENFKPFKNELSLNIEKQDDNLIIYGIFDAIEIGQVIISDFDTTVCIHDVEIYEQYGRQGYGLKLLKTTLNYIFKKYDQAILHVTKENLPAYNLYKKIGFITTEILEYYEL